MELRATPGRSFHGDAPGGQSWPQEPLVSTDGLFLATAGPNTRERGGLLREGLGWILSFPEAAFQPPGPMSHAWAHQDSLKDFLAPAPSPRWEPCLWKCSERQPLMTPPPNTHWIPSSGAVLGVHWTGAAGLAPGLSPNSGPWVPGPSMSLRTVAPFTLGRRLTHAGERAHDDHERGLEATALSRVCSGLQASSRLCCHRPAPPSSAPLSCLGCGPQHPSKGHLHLSHAWGLAPWALGWASAGGLCEDGSGSPEGLVLLCPLSAQPRGQGSRGWKG